jgi:hypothetical protein
VINKGDVVVYESTVYPGVTEDECIPVVEKVSGLKMNVDFYGGYSPERINPGDKQHTVEHIKKVTSGSTPEIGKYVNEVYASVITAGTHLAPTMKVAEAAKVIENSQRDINIYSFTAQCPWQLDFLSATCFVEDGHVIDRKLNVALTRARCRLFITGNEALLRLNPLFRQLIEFIKGKGGYTLIR